MLTIAEEPPRQPEIVALIDQSTAYMAALYPSESNHLVDLAALEQAPVRFFVARLDGRAVGCGAYVPLDVPGEAELKRMYVSASARGHGVGRALLRRIEAHAAASGIRRLLLETGIHQHEAIGLYRASGYADCPPFGAYLPDPLSLFMAKVLAAA